MPNGIITWWQQWDSVVFCEQSKNKTVHIWTRKSQEKSLKKENT